MDDYEPLCWSLCGRFLLCLEDERQSLVLKELLEEKVSNELSQVFLFKLERFLFFTF